MPGLNEYYERILGHDLRAIRYIDEDFVGARLPGGSVYTLAFGDPVIVCPPQDGATVIKIVGGRFDGVTARCKGGLPLRDEPVMRFSMVDVQQGDGMVVETPGGRIILIDGGDNQLFARHLAARYAGTTAARRLPIDGMLVTHGDADHFEGLVEIRRSETMDNTRTQPDRIRKRLFITVDRVFHNGLVKRPSSRPDGTHRLDVEMFGATVPAKPQTQADAFCVELVDDLLREVDAANLNQPFRAWRDALEHWNAAHAITIQRVDHTRSAALKQLFEQEPGFRVDVHGPIVDDAAGRPGLLFLRAPNKATEMHLSEKPAVTRAFSASHTINGHSIAFRLGFGNVRFLLTGDLNQQAMARLRQAIPGAQFGCEILKAPHHGSHDFDFAMLKRARPVVSLVSSGDESVQKEFIHPRATLTSALGRVSRGETGVVFITELAAFFQLRGPAREIDPPQSRSGDPRDPAAPFIAFERTNFGIVHVRTDGKRVLAFTHSGKAGVNEGYGFTVDAAHRVTWTQQLATRTAPR